MVDNLYNCTRLSGRELADGIKGFFKGAPSAYGIAFKVFGGETAYTATAILERDGSFEEVFLEGPSIDFDDLHQNPNFYRLTVSRRNGNA